MRSLALQLALFGLYLIFRIDHVEIQRAQFGANFWTRRFNRCVLDIFEEWTRRRREKGPGRVEDGSGAGRRDEVGFENDLFGFPRRIKDPTVPMDLDDSLRGKRVQTKAKWAQERGGRTFLFLP